MAPVHGFGDDEQTGGCSVPGHPGRRWPGPELAWAVR